MTQDTTSATPRPTPAQAKPALSLERTTKLVSRALGMTPDALTAGLRPATPADLDAVLTLRREVLAEELIWDDAAYLRWRYQFGPSGQGLGVCWVCTRGDDVIGMIGIERLSLRAGAQQRDVHSVMDIMVRPDLDGSGLGVWINQSVCDRLGCVLAIGSNPNSKGVVARTFEPLPDRRSFTHPLHMGHFLARRLSPRWLAWSLAGVADGLLMGLRIGLLWLTSLWVSVVKADQLGPEVELLLERAQRSHRVEVQRSVAGLSQRLLRNPRSHCEVWLAREDGQLTGLMAARRVPMDDGRRGWQIMDVVLAPGNEGVTLRALLARVTAHGFREGADYLSITAYDPELERHLRRLLFRQQAHEFETMAWHCPDDVFRQAVRARAGWTLLDIHTDRDQA